MNQPGLFCFIYAKTQQIEKIHSNEFYAANYPRLNKPLNLIQIDQIADRMMIEADLDRDDFMSFDEFKNSLLRIDVEKKMSIRFLN